jgi:hypothetical protein
MNKYIICTDVCEIMEQMNESIQINKNMNNRMNLNIDIGCLNWLNNTLDIAIHDIKLKLFDLSHLNTNDRISQSIDMIIASDVIWINELIEPFIQTLDQLMSIHTVIYLCYQSRSLLTDRLLFSLLKKYKFLYTLIPRSYHGQLNAQHIQIYRIIQQKK